MKLVRRNLLDNKIKLIGYESEEFIAYWWFVGWDCISLGFHVCWSAPNIEIHLPFGFVRIGRPLQFKGGCKLEKA